jgi:two-component system NtrC family sensor kinase
VARRWRIRHKLLLGLGLVVGIMVLLLLGTLRGLWSYYLTMNGIRSKMNELKEAEAFKVAVAEVVRLAEHPNNSPRPADPAPHLGGDLALHKKPETLHQAITEAKNKLGDYERQLEETLSHGRDLVNGEIARGLIESLRKEFDELEKPAPEEKAGLEDPTPEDPARPPIQGAVMATSTSDAILEEKKRQRIRGHLDKIEWDTNDLWKNLYDQVNDHIGESRGAYQVAFWIIFPTSGVGLLLICGLLRSFYAWIFHPIRDLEAGVARVAKGDFSRRIELHSGDEMEDLATAFNDMTQRLHDLLTDLARQVNERSRQLVRSERLASVGFLAAGVAHEINNPLASIAFCSEALEARLGDLLRQLRAAGRGTDDADVFAKYLKMIQEESFRCKTITERLLAFSRSGEPRREMTDLRALVQSVLDVTQHLQNHRGKRITFEVTDRPAGGAIRAWVNAEEIKSVVLNLVVNALESMGEGGHLVIRLAQQGDRAEVRFTDNGCGMTQEVLENIFEPFFTRSRTGKGTGLGLTISHRIITQHGGEIEATSGGQGQGSTFTVRLPLLQPPAGEAAEGDAPDIRPLAAARPTTRAA